MRERLDENRGTRIYGESRKQRHGRYAAGRKL